MKSRATQLLTLASLAGVLLTSPSAFSEATFSYSSATATIAYTDPACTGPFTISNGTLSCPTDSNAPPPTPQPVGSCSVSGGATVTLTTGQTSTTRTLTANCTNATAWEWSLEGNVVNGATNQTYTPTLNAGTYNYSVKATNAVDSTGKTANATVIVNPAPVNNTSCTNTNPTRYDTGFASTFPTKGIAYFQQGVAVGTTSALAFTPGNHTSGQIFVTSKSGSVSTYISECPGYVAPYRWGDGCASGYYSLTGASGMCDLGRDPNKVWYFNIKNNDSKTVTLQLKNM